MKLILTYLALFFLFSPFSNFAQEAVKSNATLRNEYYALKKESAAVLSKVKPLEGKIKSYKKEIDSLLKDIYSHTLRNARMKLFQYRDSLDCGNINIKDLLAFESVMPDYDIPLPFERLSVIQSIPEIQTISPTILLDTFPIQVENRKLESAIFLLGRSVEINTFIIEQYKEAAKDKVNLVEDIKEAIASYQNTFEVVMKFNNQVADTMVKWHQRCGGTWQTCKLCDHHSIIPKEVPELYTVVDVPADFPGGMSAFKEYLSKNMVYPKKALDEKIEGKCYVQFVVAEKGYISNVRVIRGVVSCPECDAEAVRIIKSMPNWTPGKVNGNNVNSTFNLPVQFKLN